MLRLSALAGSLGLLHLAASQHLLFFWPARRFSLARAGSAFAARSSRRSRWNAGCCCRVLVSPGWKMTMRMENGSQKSRVSVDASSRPECGPWIVERRQRVALCHPRIAHGLSGSNRGLNLATCRLGFVARTPRIAEIRFDTLFGTGNRVSYREQRASQNPVPYTFGLFRSRFPRCGHSLRRSRRSHRGLPYYNFYSAHELSGILCISLKIHNLQNSARYILVFFQPASAGPSSAASSRACSRGQAAVKCSRGLEGSPI
jgi:hypothetical protein